MTVLPITIVVLISVTVGGHVSGVDDVMTVTAVVSSVMIVCCIIDNVVVVVVGVDCGVADVDVVGVCVDVVVVGVRD
eukprot:7243157-Pyramimonas_sp.AAC.2